MPKTSEEKLILIDGSGYIFRAYYAIQRLSTSRGFPTNAIYGFINMILKVIEVEQPKKLVIAFDTGKATFRKEMYEEYKANRSAAPDDLKQQIPLILRSVDCFGIHRVDAPGFEADDVIGTIARRAEKEGYRVEIITGDKDLMQLVTDRVTLYDTMKDKRIDPQGVIEKFGVTPQQITDFLALMGDSSDNIPGVRGIGEKTAAELVKEFGSLDAIYAGIEKIKSPKRRETLLAEKDTAYLSRKLATVNCEVPLEFSWNDLEYKGPDQELLKGFFEEFEFHNLMKRFEFKRAETGFKNKNYSTIDNEAKLEEWCHRLKRVDRLAVDTETTSLNVHNAKIVGISLCAAEGEAVYIPVGHHALGNPEERIAAQLGEATVRAALKPILENAAIRKIGQNLKYDIQILRQWGIELQGLDSDTLIESYLLDPEQAHNLDSLAARYLNHQTITYEQVAGTGKAQINFAEVEIPKATEYSAEDADVAFRLHEKLGPEVEREGMQKLYREVELPLVQVLSEMEYCGVSVDEGSLRRMSEALISDIGVSEKTIYELAGETFNINSPKQLSKILFEKLKLPIIRRTKTGISTDESVLQALCGTHAICDRIVRYRELQKLRSTYVEGLLSQIHPRTGRVHTHYNQTVTATGRLSSSDPNLQNIPAGVDPKYDVRAAFVAPPGTTLLSADYSQVELRILADASGDPELVRAFLDDEDVHEYTGRLIFGVKDVSAEQRRIAKTINFGVIYGQTPYGLSQTLKIQPRDAKVFIETYFQRYRGVKVYMDGLIEEARRQGYVVTRLGRRRYIREIGSQNRMRREMAERAAINAPLQGTAADMIKIAMVKLHARMQREEVKSRLILQVHDELVLEVPKNEQEMMKAMVREEMEGAIQLKVPLKVDLGFGPNWRECD